MAAMAELTTVPSSDMDELAISASELKIAQDQLQSLCATHSSLFVAVERRGAALTDSLKTLLGALDAALPHVEESKSCLDFDSEGSGKDGNANSSNDNANNSLSSLTEKHRLRRRTLLQHSSLLELLELPSLMDACVRGQMYEEGLSIASFANTLERRHLMNTSSSTGTGTNTNTSNSSENKDGGIGGDVKNSNPIVQNVVNDVRRREGDLRRDLLNRLRSDITLPQCLEIVTALRRLNSVELERRSNHNNNMNKQSTSSDLNLEELHENMEWRLQVNFLEARDIWLEGNTTTANNSGLSLSTTKGKRAAMKGESEKLLDGIDLYRTRCFEIATQFLAIFRSSAAVSTSSKTSKSDDHAHQLLSMWTTRRINTFLQEHVVAKCLPSISDTATLRDALESVTFFATSMGRVGADFSPMLQGIFQPCLVSIVTSHWTEGLNVLENTLNICRDTGIASPLYSNREVSASQSESIESAAGVGGGGGSTNDFDSGYDTQKHSAPPRHLLSLPPLARLVNAFLIGLNELRRCLLACAFPELRECFKTDFLDKAKQILVQNERAVLTPGFLNMKGEDAGKLRSVAIELKEEFDNCVGPYLSAALEFGLGSIEKMPARKVRHVEEDEKVESSEEVTEEVAGPMHGANPDALDSKSVSEDMIKDEPLAEKEEYTVQNVKERE